MLTIKAKMLIKCILHTILEFIRGLLGKRPSHFFWNDGAEGRKGKCVDLHQRPSW